jgi:phenylpropionate dioxygenase-like ring-hydroxylating dioxygenase large terminal subunit
MGESDKTFRFLEEAARAFEQGMLPAGVFNDPGLFELEKERIFKTAWIFLAHETEIPKPGDYVLRSVVYDSFIIVRDDEGLIRVLFNTCRHRGSQVCRAERGNASSFRCAYHGWTYRNTGELIGVPFQKKVYGDHFDKSEWGLLQAPKVEFYEGLIFASLDSNVPSLVDYLGDARWYFDFYTKKSRAGLEVMGAPQRWIVPADWKLGADNFMGDAYHTSITHRSMVETGILFADSADFHLEGPQWVTPRAAGGFMPIPPGSYAGYPPSIVASWKGNLSPDQWQVVEDRNFFLTHSTLFPNVSFLNAASVPDPGPPVPWFTIRQWCPLGPGQMELRSWFLVEKDAPEDFRQASRKSFLLSFGISGTAEQDDAENWSSISRMARGELSRQLYLNYQMGLNHLEPISEWPGPGEVYPIDYTEYGQRQFWKNYFERMLSRGGTAE